MLRLANFVSSSSSVSFWRSRQLCNTKASSSSSFSYGTVSRLVALILLATAQTTFCAQPPLLLQSSPILKLTPNGHLDKILSCGDRLASPSGGSSKEAVNVHLSFRVSSSIKTTVRAVSSSNKEATLQVVSSRRWSAVHALFCYRIRPARLQRSVVREKTGRPLMIGNSFSPEVVNGQTPLRLTSTGRGPVLPNTAFCSADALTAPQLAHPNHVAAVNPTFLPHPEAHSDHSQFDVHPKWDSAPALNSGRSLSVPDDNTHISFKVETDYDQAHSLMFGTNQQPSGKDKVGDVLKNASILHPPVALYLMPGCPFCNRVLECLARVNADKTEYIQLRFTLNDDGTPNRFETELLEKTGGRRTQPVMELQGGALIGESSNIVKLLEEYFRRTTYFSGDQADPRSV